MDHSPRLAMSLHSDTLSCFRTNQYVIVLEHRIYRFQWDHFYQYTMSIGVKHSTSEKFKFQIFQLKKLDVFMDILKPIVYIIVPRFFDIFLV